MQPPFQLPRSTLKRITDDIENIRVKNDFFRWLSWRIRTLDELYDNPKEKIIPALISLETAGKHRYFVGLCVELYNVSHPTESTVSIVEVQEYLAQAWNNDANDYLAQRQLT